LSWTFQQKNFKNLLVRATFVEETNTNQCSKFFKRFGEDGDAKEENERAEH
jgi:hypothetical protein